MRLSYIKLCITLIAITLAVGASTPNKLIQKSNDIEGKLTSLFQQSTKDSKVFEYNLPKNPKALPVFTDKRMQSALQDLLEIKSSLYKLTQDESKFRTNPRSKNIKNLSEIAARYLSSVQAVYLFYIQALHTRGAPKTSDSFERLEELNLRLKKNAFTMTLLSQLAPMNVRHLNHNEVEVIVTESDKQNLEFSALQRIEERLDYSKFIQFAAVRERLVNRWALQRMTTDNLFKKQIRSCAPDVLSFKSGIHNGLDKSNAYLGLHAEDLITLYNQNQPKIVGKIIGTSLGDQRFYEDVISTSLNSFQSIKDKLDSLSLIEPEELAKIAIEDSKRTQKEFAKALQSDEVLSTEKSDQKDIPSAIEIAVSQSYFLSDNWNSDEITDRIINTIADYKSDIILESASIIVSDLLKQIGESQNNDQIRKQIKQNLGNNLIKTKANYIAKLRPAVFAEVNNINSSQNLRALRLKLRNEKLNELREAGTKLAQVAYEIQKIKRISTDNDKLWKNYNIPNDIRFLPKTPRDLQIIITKLLESRPENKFLASQFSKKSAQELLYKFFNNVTNEFEANIYFRSLKSDEKSKILNQISKLPKDQQFTPSSADSESQLLAVISKKVAFELQDQNPPKKGFIDITIRNPKMDRFSNSPTRMIEDINAGEAFARLMDQINLRKDSKRPHATSNSGLAFSLLHRKLFLDAFMEEALVNYPMLRTEMEEKFYNPGAGRHGMGYYQVIKTPASELLAKAYDSKSYKVNSKEVQSIVTTVFNKVYENESDALETFCTVDISKYDSDDYRKLFHSTAYIRQVLDSTSEKIRKHGEEIAKRSRTWSQVALDDYIFPAMHWSFIGLAVVGLVMLPFSGAIMAGSMAMFSAMGTAITWGSHITFGLLTAASLACRAHYNWYETPMQIRYQETLMASQISQTPNLLTIGKDKHQTPIPIQNFDKISELKSANGLVKTFDIALLPLDIWFGGVLVKQIKNSAGYAGVKALAKSIGRPVRFYIQSPKRKLQQLSGMSESFAKTLKNTPNPAQFGLKMGDKVITNADFVGSESLLQYLGQVQAKSIGQKTKASIEWLKNRVNYLKLWLPKYQAISNQELQINLKNELVTKIPDVSAVTKAKSDIQRHIEFLKQRREMVHAKRLKSKAFQSEDDLIKYLDQNEAAIFGPRDAQLEPQALWLWSFTGAKSMGQTVEVLRQLRAEMIANGTSRSEMLKQLAKAAFGKESSAVNWFRRNGEVFDQINTWREAWIQGKIVRMEGWLKHIDEIVSHSADPMYFVRNNTTPGREFLRIFNDPTDFQMLKEVSAKPGFFARGWKFSEKLDARYNPGPIREMNEVFNRYDHIFRQIKPIGDIPEIEISNEFKWFYDEAGQHAMLTGRGKPEDIRKAKSIIEDDIILDETKDLSHYFEISVITDAPGISQNEINQIMIKLIPKEKPISP